MGEDEEKEQGASADEVHDLVGRTEEIRRLRRLLLVERCAVATLWGPGGIGKTRLAREVAGRCASGFPGGVHFCELAEARRPEEAIDIVAEVLGLRATPAPSGRERVQRVGRSLSMRGRALVVLDNVEQIASEVQRALGVWTVQAPEATFLVTSRELLGFPGEALVEVPPLALPADEGEALDSDAVRLLLKRARALRPELTAPLATLREIVARLDGIPLAIELCAARLGVLSPEQVRDRLDQRFDLLATTHPTLAPRQRTMRAAIAWSWDLLGDGERDLLADLSVLSGAFDLAAAEAVASDAARGDVALGLDSLRSKSLLVAAGTVDGSPCLRMLETVRAYASDKLGSRAPLVRDRHAAYFVARGAELAEQADGPEGARALAWLGRERKNLLAVLDHFLEAPSPARATMALGAMAPLERALAETGGLALLVDVGARVLARARLHDVDHAMLWRATEAHGLALLACAKIDESRAVLEEAHDLARHVSLAARAQTAISLGTVLQVLGRPEQARALLTAALAASREAGDRRLEGRCVAGLAYVDHLNDRFELARDGYQRALAIHVEVGDVAAETRCHARLGFALQDMGEAGAVEHYEKASLLTRSRGGGPFEGSLVGYRGNALRGEGRFEEAHAAYTEAITRLRLAGDKRYETTFMMDRAVLFELEGRMREAADELDALEPSTAEIGDARLAGLVAGYRAVARAARGDVAFARATIAREREKGQTNALFLDLHAAHVALFESRDHPSAELASAATREAEGALSRAGGRPRGLHVQLAVTLLRSALDRMIPPLDALVVTRERDRARAPGGAWVDLRGRPTLVAVLSRLVDARLSTPGEPVSTDALVKAGWPGERMVAQAGQNRLRVLVASLRTQGLAAVIRSARGGYLLDPGIKLVIGEPPRHD